jgi:hypothetical protein
MTFKEAFGKYPEIIDHLWTDMLLHNLNMPLVSAVMSNSFAQPIAGFAVIMLNVIL